MKEKYTFSFRLVFRDERAAVYVHTIITHIHTAHTRANTFLMISQYHLTRMTHATITLSIDNNNNNTRFLCVHNNSNNNDITSLCIKSRSISRPILNTCTRIEVIDLRRAGAQIAYYTHTHTNVKCSINNQ